MCKITLIVFISCSDLLLAQQWNWAANGGGGGNTDLCNGIATDSKGSAYSVGTVSGTAEFGCATLSPGNLIGGTFVMNSVKKEKPALCH